MAATPKTGRGKKPRRFSLDKMLGNKKKGRRHSGPASARGGPQTSRPSVTPLTEFKVVNNLKTKEIVAGKILAEEVSTLVAVEHLRDAPKKERGGR